MIECAKQGDFDCIMVRELSRFGRDYIETGRYLQNILPLMGIRFISVLDHIDTDHMTDNQEMLMKLRLLIDDAYSQDISVKTRKALRAMRDKGMYIGACPIYGYRKSEYNRHQLVIDEVTAPIVKEIFKLKIQGYSLNKIMKILNDKNIPSPLEYKKRNEFTFAKSGFTKNIDTKWSASTILRILKDETYKGTLIQGKVTTINYKLKVQIQRSAKDIAKIKNTHQAITSKNDFALVQRVLSMNVRISSKQGKRYLLSGLIVCGSCGKNMTIKTVRSKNKIYRYYYCPTGKKNGCLTPRMIKCEKLEQEVFRQIRDYIKQVSIIRDKLQQMSKQKINKFFTYELYTMLDESYDNNHQIESCTIGV